MLTSWSLCILLLVFLHEASSQHWSPILEPTGGSSGNLGLLHTNRDKSNFGGYLHGDLNHPGLINGFGIRGSYQGNRFNVGGDAHVRFPVGNSPLFGASASGNIDLTPRLNLGAHVNTQFGGGLSRPDFGAGLSLRYRFPRKRRAIACLAECDNACRRSSNECVGDCIVQFC